jgi:hypothetical protein
MNRADRAKVTLDSYVSSVAEFSLTGTTVSGAVCWRSERHQ